MTRDGADGAIRRYLIEAFPGTMAGLYAATGLLFITLAIVIALRNRANDGLTFAVVGAAILMVALRRRKRKERAIIERSSVRAVRTRDPGFLSRQATVTIYCEEEGRIRAYALQLPQATDRGLDEYEWAKTLLYAEGLLHARNSSPEASAAGRHE